MDNLIVSPSPHFRGKSSTHRIMLDVIIALLPCVAAGIWLFGPKVLLTLSVTVSVSVAAEYISRKIMKRKNTVKDLSAIVSGLILGLILPPGISPFIAAFGAVTAIVVIKQMFGGIGENFVNPAGTARIVLLVSFASQMTKWPAPFAWMEKSDAITSATPLISGDASYLDLFLGKTAGCIGETCAIAVLAGFIYLLVRKVVNPIIPFSFIASSALITFVLGGDVLYQLLSGGLLFGAVFMATDYATCPISNTGRLIYGAGCGILTILFRFYASAPEGVSYAIVMMDIITPHLDYIFIPHTFGKGRKGGPRS